MLKIRSGLAGEQQVRWYWQGMHLEIEHVLFHDFQSSCMILPILWVPYLYRGILFLIVEVKNIIGEISLCEARHQFVRQCEDGAVEVFCNPLD